jgi:hypothetical protein
MFVQVSGMIGANSVSRLQSIVHNCLQLVVYQPTDAPRYFKANKGLLVICIWMCVSTRINLATSATRAAASTNYNDSLSNIRVLTSTIDGGTPQRLRNGTP